MKLFLVQHGEAVDKDVDPDRPLSAKGRADVGRIAAVVARAAAPAKILHSGKTRAFETAEIVCAALGREGAAVAVSGIGPLDPVAEFAAGIDALGDGTLLCGHQPFMGRLTAWLLSGDESASVVEFRPGSAACLKRGEDGSWTIAWFLRPELCTDQ